jgi:hypothetical protein
MSETEVEEKPGVNWIQVVAGALAAVSSAVLLSTLGVAGTVIGAALGSVIASVASAWYSRGIDASRQQVAAQAAALKRVAAARSKIDDAVSARNRGETGADTGLMQADLALGEAEQALEEASHLAEGEAAEPDGDEVVEPVPHDPLFGAEAGRKLPWKRIALIAAGLFVVVMVAITIFELTTGRAVSSFTGGSDKNTGSTVPGIQQAPEETKDEPSPGDSKPSQSEEVAPTDETEPTDDPTVEPTTEPTVEPVTPTAEPSATLSPTATPSAEPSVTPDESTG